MGKLFLLFPLLLFSCGYIDKKFGRSQGYSQVTIQQSRNQGLNTSSILNGGLIVYAVKEDGSRKAASLSNENGSLTITLPNGSYQFYAVGWPKVGLESSPPAYNLRCATIGPLALTGQSTTVSLTMNSSNCASSSAFASSNAKAGGTIPNLQFVNCAPTNNVNVGSAGGNCEPTKGSFVGSGRVRLLTYEFSSGPLIENGSLSSGCFSGVFSSGMNIPAPIVIPPGVPGGNSPFATRIEVFSEPDCAGTPVVYDFPKGIANGSAGNSTALFGNGQGDLSLYLNAPAVIAEPVSLYSGSIGAIGYSDGIGKNATFSGPGGMAADAYGNLYVADVGNTIVRRIRQGGAVEPFAGDPGVVGSADGQRTAATFNNPGDIALGPNGIVYVADTTNHTIRKIDASGVVSTFAGSAGVDGPADGNGSAARFNSPMGIAVDSSGNIYVADQGNHKIRKITPNADVTTIAGSGSSGNADGTGASASFNTPGGIALDGNGNLFVADTDNHTIRKIDLGTFAVTTFAGLAGSPGDNDGSGSAARFHTPTDLGIDGSGNIYVGDSFNATVRKITPAGAVTTYAGTSGALGSADGVGAAAKFASTGTIAVDNLGQVFVGDPVNNNIRKIAPGAVVTTYVGRVVETGNADGARAVATYDTPAAITADASGNLYLVDSLNFNIRTISAAGVVSTLAGSGTSGSADGTGAAASFFDPRGIAVDGAGNVYVADGNGEKIRKITSGGVVTSFAGGGSSGSGDGTGAAASFSTPAAIAADSAGNLYVADKINNTIRKITPAGTVSTIAGSAGSSGTQDGTGAAARFNQPTGIAVDSTDSFLYVSDTDNHTIRKINLASFAVTTLAGNPGTPGDADGTGAAAEFNYPAGLKVDASNNIYVADEFNNLIRKITPAGVVTTLLGTVGSFGGQTGSLASTVFAPKGIALYSGKLYVTEANGVIQVILP